MTQVSHSALDKSLQLEADYELDVLLEYLKQSHHLDFTSYRPSTVMRRVKKRMLNIEVKSYRDYIDYLEVHPEEVTHLLNTVLINVTTFFRDPSVWDQLTHQLIPEMLSSKKAN